MLLLSYSCRLADSGPDHITWADSVVDHANLLMNGNHPEYAISYLDAAYHAAGKRGVADLWRKYNTKVNYYTKVDPNPMLKWQYLDSMQLILKGRETLYKFEYTHTLLDKGSALQAEKKYNQAFKCYFDGKRFAANNMDSCSLSDFSNCLGNICYQKEEFLKAVPYLQQAYEECRHCRQSENFYYGFILPQGLLNSTALCYERAHMPDSAVYYYRQALQCIRERSATYPKKQAFIEMALGVVEGNLGGVYVRLRNFTEAEKHLKTSISLNDREGYAIEDAQTAKTKLADLYLKFNHYGKLDTLLAQLEKDIVAGRGKSLENDQVVGKWIYLKWRYYEKLNNVPEAYRYMKQYHAFNDSMLQVRSALKHTDMEQFFTDHEHELEMTVLQKNNEVKTAYLAAAAFFLVMFIGIALTIWYYLNRSKKHIKTLKALNAHLKSVLIVLRQSQDANSKMMKIVAHDLRNPISAMTAIADLMLMDDTRSEDDVHLLQLVKTSGDNCLKLVKDLLQVNAQKDLQKEPVDLEELLNYCVDLLQHKAQAKNQTILLDTASVTIPMHQEKMWRVISNLIANAIKFSAEGASIVVKMEQLPQRVLITVTDPGIGIPVSMQQNIFDIFTGAQRTGTAGEESYGIGLSVSRQIVEAHGGRIWFNSEVNKGTSFFVELPFEVAGRNEVTLVSNA